MPRLTILICTHDRAQLLSRTLVSLNAAVRPAGWTVDLLVAANACCDGTHTLLEQYRRDIAQAGHLPLDWFAEPAPGKSNALNSALTRIDADLVAFVDDDHRVDAAYLTALCRAADDHPEAGLFCGRILPDWDGSEPGWVHDTGPYRIYPLPVPRFDQGDEARELGPEQAVPGGGNLAVRAAWLQRVGRFATDLGPHGHDLGGSEDLDWVLRALGLGARLRYVPQMIQHHYVDADRLTLVYLIRKAYKRTASTVRVESVRDAGLRRVPLYLYRKIGVYGLKAVSALASARRRFYLVRTAAALGELAGHLKRGQSAVAAPAPRTPTSR